MERRASQKVSNGVRYVADAYSDLPNRQIAIANIRSLVSEDREWEILGEGVTETFSIKSVIRRNGKTLSSLRQVNVYTVSDGAKLKFAAVSSQMVDNDEWDCHLIGGRLCLTLDEAESLAYLEDKRIDDAAAAAGDAGAETQFFDDVRRFLRDRSGAGL